MNEEYDMAGQSETYRTDYKIIFDILFALNEDESVYYTM